MTKIISELKQMVKAYRVSCEYDYCPGEDEYKNVVRDCGPIKKATLGQWQGHRPDEIVNAICDVIAGMSDEETK